tara:strand:+ start:1989 stop:2390 length:402 start_codon:yes stop_codon:yes gene_type:complete
MANALYPLYKEAILGSATNSSMSAGTVKVALVDTGTYTYSAAHEFYSSISGVVGTDQTLGTKTITTGTFDSANPTWTAVTGATVEALVIYIDTGTAGTSRLIAYIDTGQTGLPVTPNGGDITFTVDAAGWFTL